MKFKTGDKIIFKPSEHVLKTNSEARKMNNRVCVIADKCIYRGYTLHNQLGYWTGHWFQLYNKCGRIEI